MAYGSFPKGQGALRALKKLGAGNSAIELIALDASGMAGYHSLSAYARDTLFDLANAAAAASEIGVGTEDSPQFTGIELGHATDTTIARVSAGRVSVEGSNVLMASDRGDAGADGVQAWDADLDALAALDATAGYLVKTGAGAFARRTLTGTANQVSVTNGDGTTGNPVLSTPQDINTTASVTFDTLALGGVAGSTQLDVQNGNARIGGDLTIVGQIFAQGLTNIDTETVLVEDNYIDLNNGYTSDAAVTGGLTVRFDPTTVQQNVHADGIFTGLGEVDGYVTVTDASVFSVGDIVALDGTNGANDGLCEVASTDTGSTPEKVYLASAPAAGAGSPAHLFCRDTFTTSAGAAGTITKVEVAVMQVATDGFWQAGKGSTAAAITSSLGDILYGTPAAGLTNTNGVLGITWGTPDTSLSATTADGQGTADTFARSDHSHDILADTAPSPDAAVAVTGVSAHLARADHVHSTVPTSDTEAHGAVGGNRWNYFGTDVDFDGIFKATGAEVRTFTNHGTDANYTVLATDRNVHFTATLTAARDCQFEAAPATGRILTVKHDTDAAFDVQVKPGSGGNIDGLGEDIAYDLAARESATFIHKGSDIWSVY